MEALSPFIGEFGRIQLYIYLVCGIAGIPGAMQIYVMTFYSPDIDFWCARPDGLINENVTAEVWKNYSSPLEEVDDKIERSKCNVYDVDFENVTSESLLTLTSSTNKTRECTKWEYDDDFYDRTMTKEFNLVCSRNVLISTSNAVYMIGFMIGVIVNGHLADRHGRKIVIIVNNFFLIIVSIAMAFSGSFISFMILRGFQCFFMLGLNPGFVLFTEMCSEKYRAILGNLFFWGFAVGIISFAGLAYLLRNWYHMQFIISIPFIFILMLYWFIPESPVWLITQGRYKDAAKSVRKIAKFNRIKIPNDNNLETTLEKLHRKESGGEVKNHTFLDIMRHRLLRKTIINLYFCWFVNSFVYYGLSFNTNNLAGDQFINFFLSSVVEIPAYIMGAIAVRLIGRKIPLLVTMVIGGLACASTIVIPADHKTLIIVFTMIGKFCISSSFGMIYVYSAELVPTVVRNIGIGSCSMVGRFGSILAPYVKELGLYTHQTVPPLIFGILAILSGSLIMLLPETKDRAIPNEIEDTGKLYRQLKLKKDEQEMTKI